MEIINKLALLVRISLCAMIFDIKEMATNCLLKCLNEKGLHFMKVLFSSWMLCYASCLCFIQFCMLLFCLLVFVNEPLRAIKVTKGEGEFEY